MADSVKPWTRAEIRWGIGRSGSAASGDGGHDRDGVAVLEPRRPALQEADVFLVDVEIDEAAQLALLVDEALTESGELPLEVLHDVIDGAGLGLDLGVALGERSQRSRDPYHHGHAVSLLNQFCDVSNVKPIIRERRHCL